MPDCPACQAPLLIFLFGKNGSENHLRDTTKMVCPVTINFEKPRRRPCCGCAERCWIKKKTTAAATTTKPPLVPLPSRFFPPFLSSPPYPLLLYTPYYPPTPLCRVCVLVVVVVVFYYIFFIYPCLYCIEAYIKLYDI